MTTHPPRPIGRRPDGRTIWVRPAAEMMDPPLSKERAVTLLRPASDGRAPASGGAPAPGSGARRATDPVLCGLYKARTIGCKARGPRGITVLRRGRRDNQDFWRERGHQDPQAGGTHGPRAGARVLAAFGAFGLLYRRSAVPRRAAGRGAAAPVRPRGGRPARA
jgi:hypothetical protein